MLNKKEIEELFFEIDRIIQECKCNHPIKFESSKFKIKLDELRRRYLDENTQTID